jgi:hypothetical protein
MCFIVPSYVYTNLVEKGSPEQKSFAKDCLDFVANLTSIRGNLLLELLPAKISAKNSKLNRSIYDIEHSSNFGNLPGKLVRKEGQVDSKDVSVNEAYNGSGKTWEFFNKILGRNSIDNNGMELVSTVHFGRNFANAFWNGKQMTYGPDDWLVKCCSDPCLVLPTTKRLYTSCFPTTVCYKLLQWEQYESVCVGEILTGSALKLLKK